MDFEITLSELNDAYGENFFLRVKYTAVFLKKNSLVNIVISGYFFTVKVIYLHA